MALLVHSNECSSAGCCDSSSALVQELKRLAYELGSIPAARCDTGNIASRKTLQKAGFVPCANILNGTIAPPS